MSWWLLHFVPTLISSIYLLLKIKFLEILTLEEISLFVYFCSFPLNYSVLGWSCCIVNFKLSKKNFFSPNNIQNYEYTPWSAKKKKKSSSQSSCVHSSCSDSHILPHTNRYIKVHFLLLAFLLFLIQIFSKFKHCQ